MSKRRFKFNITDINELAKFCPKAVTEIHIPARTEFKANYAVVANLLEAGMAVPGIEVVEDAGSDQAQPEAKDA